MTVQSLIALQAILFALGASGVALAVVLLIVGRGYPVRGGWGLGALALISFAILGLTAVEILSPVHPKALGIPYGLLGAFILMALWTIMLPTVGAISRRVGRKRAT